MWKKFRSNSSYSAKVLRNYLRLQLCATNVVVIDKYITMAEWRPDSRDPDSLEQKTLPNGGKIPIERINYRINGELLNGNANRKKSLHHLVNKNPTPLKPEEWKKAHCGIGVIKEGYNNHANGCKECRRALSPKSVQQVAQGMVSRTANAINNSNKNAPVKITPYSSSPSVVASSTILEARQNSIPIQDSDAVSDESPIEAIQGKVIREPSVSKDRGEDFIHYTERKTQSFKELLTQFDDKLTKMFTTIDGLFEWHQQAQKWLDGIGDVETELKKIEQLQLEIERRRKIVRSNLDK